MIQNFKSNIIQKKVIKICPKKVEKNFEIENW